MKRFVGFVDERRCSFCARFVGARVAVGVCERLQLEEFGAQSARVDGEWARGRWAGGEGLWEEGVVSLALAR